MRTGTTLTLLALTIGLTSWIILRESKGPPPNLNGQFLFDYTERLKTDSAEVENNLNVIRPPMAIIGEAEATDAMASGWEFRAAEVAGIDIRSAAGTLALKRRADGSWDIVKDIKDRADRAFVAQLLKFCTEARIVETLDHDELKKGTTAAEKLGLDDAGSWRVSWKREGGGKLAEIRVGKTAPLGNAAYVQVEGERRRPDVYIVQPDLRTFLARPLDTFRDPRLSRFAETEVLRMTVRKGEGEVEFSRASVNEQAAAPWVISRPLPNAPAFQDGVKDLVAMICGATIEGTVGVPSLDTPPDASEKPVVEVTLFSAASPDKKGMTLSFFNDPTGGDKTALCRDRERKATFKVAKQIVDDLATLNLPDDLRETKLAALDSRKIHSLNIVPLEGDATQVCRVGDKWSWRPLAGGTFSTAAPERVEKLITDINETEIIGYASDSLADPALFALDNPAFTIAVGFAPHPSLDNLSTLSPTTSRTLRIGITGEGKIYANWKEEPFVYLIAPELPSIIPSSFIKWRSLVLPGYSGQQVHSIIQTIAPGPALRLDFDSQTFKWTGVTGGVDVTDRIKTSVVETLASRIGALSAKAWLENPGDAIAALEKPAITIEVKHTVFGERTADDKIETIVYEFAPTSTTNAPLCYGRITGALGPFLIDSVILKQAGASLLTK